jgi:nucleoside-diphosphate-sugar epimerase
MKLLIFGGTRFIGRLLARRLVLSGHDVTVSSRRPESAPKGVKVLAGERKAIIEHIPQKTSFDLIIDFTAYDSDSVKRTLELFPESEYILISSLWVTWLIGSSLGDAFSLADAKAPSHLLEVTKNYIESKSRAENEVLKVHSKGRYAVALRLPIIWGHEDHTGRLDFYRGRARGQKGQILVAGGRNLAQITFSDDIAKAIVKLIETGLKNLSPILEGISFNGITVSSILELVAHLEGVPFKPIDASVELLSKEFPIYLEHEPLWREREISISDNNIFQLTQISPTPIREWLYDIIANQKLSFNDNDLRRNEIAFLSKFSGR